MISPKILIATGNKGKFREISNLLKNTSVTLISLSDYNILEPIENGNSFSENSLIKAKYYAKKTNLVSLSDDSGLAIKLLNGEPGIHSARWAIDEHTKEKDFKIAFTKILKKLEDKNIDVKNDKIDAYFICSLTIFNPKNNQHHTFEGRVDGFLSFPPIGNNGFGYDPIFIPNDYTKTFGQFEEKIKDKISHRNNAFIGLNKFLESVDFKKFIDV
jgi:XTP/dITP diphosphohydrolase